MSNEVPSFVSYDRLLHCLLTRLKSGEVGSDPEYFADLLLSLERRAKLLDIIERKRMWGANESQSSGS